MEHVVFYPGAGGVPAFQRVGSLDAAVSYVERLRNTANVTEFSVYELTPVPLSMRAYYRVEVPAADETAAEDTAVPGSSPQLGSAQDSSAQDAAAPVADEPTLPLTDSEYAEPASSVDAPPAEPDEVLAVPAVEQAVQFALGDLADLDEVTPEPAPEAAVAVDAVVRPQPVELVQEPVQEPVLAAELSAPAEADDADTQPATSEILTAAAAAAAYVRAPVVEHSDEPVADEDRSEEWVAEASVIEPAFVTPELPVLSDDSASPDALHLAVAPSVAAPLPPSLQVTPFAVAPPVGSSMPAPYDPSPEDIADFPVAEAAGEPDSAPAEAMAFEPVGGDIIPTVPASRRSMGFFAR